MFDRFSAKMSSRSAALLPTIDNRLGDILKFWLWTAGIASIARIVLAPHSASTASFSTFGSYMLLIVAPFASTLLALRWFSADLRPQLTTRLARVGRWRGVSRSEAQRHPLYGTDEIMVSLLVGIHAEHPRFGRPNISRRRQPMPARRAAVAFGSALRDDGGMSWSSSSLYMIAFVAALRRASLFPRLLLAIWIGDLAMQLVTAQMVSSTHVPATVAAALQTVLEGNVKKVLISMALWLPYLLLSTRVNVTYRQRVPG